ncbi:MAG: NADH-quinone oxidoreductase subunit N [Thermodesulfobacteriota bacterium]
MTQSPSGRELVQDISLLTPEAVLLTAALLLLLLGVVLPHPRRRRLFTLVSLAGLAGSLAPLLPLTNSPEPWLDLSPLFLLDPLAVFFKAFLALAGAVTILMSHDSPEIEGRYYNEYAVLVLTATAGMMLLVSARDLLMIYLAFETMSLLAYLLVSLKVRDVRAGEAALKYILYGGFTSGVMLFGFSLLYGLSGTTDVAATAQAVAAAGLHTQNRPLLVLAMLCLLAGLLFKTASFPFHFWCPDVYQGAPTPVTAFLSVGPKAAGFVLFIRLFYPLFAAAKSPAAYEALPGLKWPALLALIAAVTMTLGNLAALRQNNLKRLLAYSSIAHAGYLYMGLASLTRAGLESVVFYLTVYLFMNMGAFGFVTAVISAGGGEDLPSYSGLGSKAPFLGVAMTVFLFSLIGLPPLAGFIGKIYLFAAVIEQKIYWLAVTAAVNTVISLYYYVKVVKVIFLDPFASFEPRLTPGSKALLVALMLPLFGLGLYWQPLAETIGLIF